jgi:serine/threonine protein kinase
MKDLRHPNIIQLVDSFLEVPKTLSMPKGGESQNGVRTSHGGERVGSATANTKNLSGVKLHILMEYADHGDLFQVSL